MLVRTVVLAALACGRSPSDLAIHERTSIEGPDAKTREVTRYYGTKKVVTEGQRQRTIIDLDARTMTLIDKQAKAYILTGFDDLAKQTEALRTAFSRLPEEVQKQQLASDVQVTTKPTGRTEQILGYTATEYVVDAGSLHGSIWVAERLAVPPGKREWDSVSASLRGVTRLGDRFSDAIAELKGVPLRQTIATQSGKDGEPPTQEVTEVVSVSTEAPAADTLRVPDGFTKWTLPNLGS